MRTATDTTEPVTWSEAVAQLTGHADRMASLTDTNPDDVLALGMDRLVRWAEADSWAEMCPALVLASAKACQRFGARRLAALARQSRGEDWLAELWTDADAAEAQAYLAEMILALRPEHRAPLLAYAAGEHSDGGAGRKRLARAREALAVACLRHGFEHVANRYLATVSPVVAELVRLQATLATRI